MTKFGLHMFLWFSAKKIRGLSNLCWSKVITATIALHVIGHLWMLTYNRIKKNKTNSCTTCSLFEEVSSCAGVCCTLHLLKLPNQVWNIMVFSYITILSKLLSIQSVTVIATCLSLKWSVPLSQWVYVFLKGTYLIWSDILKYWHWFYLFLGCEGHMAEKWE